GGKSGFSACLVAVWWRPSGCMTATNASIRPRRTGRANLLSFLHTGRRGARPRETDAPTNNLATAREELRMKKLLLTLATVAATLFSPALYADNYPSRPITIVNVFGPGSGSDTICRIIADKLSPVLGQPVLVED